MTATAESSSTVTILLSSSSRTDSSISLALLLHSSHRRHSLEDPIEIDLEYFYFHDDRRSFPALDALLTRWGRLSTVYLVDTNDVTTLQRLLLSRTDCLTDSSVHLVPPLSSTKCIALAQESLLRLLHGPTSSEYLAYRGDLRIAEEPLILSCMGHFFHHHPLASSRAQLRPGTLASRLTLDRTAAEAIHLLSPRPGSGAALLTGGNATNNSLYAVLNHCETKMGSRTLEVWLRQPLVHLEDIRKRHRAVAVLVEVGLGRERLRGEGLRLLRSLDLDWLGGALTKFGKSNTCINTSKALEALYKVYLVGETFLPPIADILKDILQQASNQQETTHVSNGCALQSTLEAIHQTYLELAKGVQLSKAVIDFNAAPRDFIVNPNLDSDLVELQAELEEVQIELQAIHSDMNALWSQESGQKDNQVRLEDVDSNNNTSCVWQFRLPRTNDAKLLTERFTGVKVHRILKNGVYFSTKELEQLGTKKKDLMAEYQEKQRDIVTKAMVVAASYVPVLERASVVLAELDVLASLAHVAAYSSGGYCCPEMTDGDEDGLGIELVEARHPCVELQNDMNFIPNNFNLKFGSSSFLLVTGPNMGGKSTYIRSLGAIVTMAQIGSFVPCTSAKINIVHHILARVGAGDAQDRGISTFMAEMLEASSILRTSTKRSLIIIDELGRGTSTYDGLGLAKAISEYIIQKIGCITVFATHFHELTALEEQEPDVSNCHVTAYNNKQSGLTFLYEVRPGPCLESFGIQVAEMVNFPPHIIADAKRKAKQLENFNYSSKKSKDSSTLETDREEEVEESERTAAAMEFLYKFRKLPLRSMSIDEANTAVLPLLRQYGFQPRGVRKE